MSEAPEGIPPMVHAVAEALRAACLKEYGSNWNYDVSWSFARAAIEAMREPTKAMIERGSDQCDGSKSAAEGVWWNMLDAALAEPPASR